MSEIKSYPKEKRIKLTGRAYHRLRWKAFYRASGCCEYCGRYAPFDSDYMTNGELSHIKSRGSGGDDHIDNVMWACLECHQKHHAGNL